MKPKTQRKIIYPKDMIYDGRVVTSITVELTDEEIANRVHSMQAKSDFNRCAVKSIDEDGTEVIYKSQTDAAKCLGICQSQISWAIKVDSKAGQLKWSKL